MTSGRVVTFDLFSALTDSRTGGARTFAAIAVERGWSVTGTDLYDRWDRHNKAGQRTARPPTTFHDLSRAALGQAYDELGLPASAVAGDLARLEESVADWPLWPDVEAGVRTVATVAEVGILSNVDDALARRTRAWSLVDPDLVLTSERLGAYKPDPAIYRAAVTAVAPRELVHVAASSRDVRGALEAGISTVRLARPGHVVDPDGPQPSVQVEDAADLRAALS